VVLVIFLNDTNKA